MTTPTAFLDAFEAVFAELEPTLDPNGAAFCRRCFETDPEIYLNRLRAAGLEGCDAVLDAGCGYGQWALALAEASPRVAAVDVASERLIFLSRMAAALERNVDPRWGSLDALPFDDASFDGVFCYQAIFTSRWRQALAEFARVLRPGGRLYFNANGAGWYLHTWQRQPNPAAHHDPRDSPARAFASTLRYERHDAAPDGALVIPRDDALAELARLGFDGIRSGGDGTLSVRDDVEPKPFFPGELYGLDGVWEVVATKG